MPEDADVEAGSDTTTARARLAGLITEIAEVRQQLATLDEVSTRARERSWHASSELTEAEAELRHALADQPRRLVHAFVDNSDAPAADYADPVLAARHTATQARAEIDHIRRLADALCRLEQLDYAEARRLAAL
jgi:hypothetical protein